MPGFPPGFVWGAGTAAYQVEGAVAEDGRGPSIWDTFSHRAGVVLGGDTGDIACDHYHRYAEDVALMRQMRLASYRFSLSWPRVQPTGRGPLNEAGVGFYDRLIDELLAADIRPWVTLYHWDLPQPLEDAGGWPVRDTAARFVDYALAISDRFADRVTDWHTVNEPWCSAFLGYFNGVHAPGRTEPAASLRAVHHLLLGHGMAVRALRQTRPEQNYGIALNLYPVDPRSDSDADRDAARRVDGVSNRIFLDPVLRGEYPADVVADLGATWPADAVADGDLETIAAPLDTLGINYYTRHVVHANAPAGSIDAQQAGWVGCADVAKVQRGLPVTAMDWEVDPRGLYDVLTMVARNYPQAPPLYVTENGAAFDDVVDTGGPAPAVHDAARVDYLDTHFRAAADAIADGVDLRGYFVWSLLDNFEWAWGYSRRFGIVHVDYDSLARTVKDSGHFLARVAATNGADIRERSDHAV